MGCNRASLIDAAKELFLFYCIQEEPLAQFLNHVQIQTAGELAPGPKAG